ncbi:MAG: tetratricopeptide repeat protein, partial [Burkholderiales bacterium]
MNHPRRRSASWSSRALWVGMLLVSGTPAAAAPAQPDDIGRVRALLDRGAFAAAEQLTDSLWTTTEIPNQAVTGEQLQVLLLAVEARIRNGKANEPRTRILAERAVQLSRHDGKADSEETARAYDLLGELQFERGEFHAALKSHLLAQGIRVRASPDDDAARANSLERLARSEILLERFKSARSRLDRLMTIRAGEAASAPQHYGAALELMALWYRYAGDYAAALPLVEKVVAIRRTAFPDEPHTTSLLDLHGDLLFLRGDLSQAQQKWAQGLELSGTTLDHGHPSVALFLRKLALVADAVGDRAESRRLLDEAVRIGMPRLPPCHPDVAGLLNDSAQQSQRDGTYADARRKYQQLLRMLEKCHRNANWTATALHNLASLFFEMGDLAESERLHTRAVHVWSTRLGPRHSHVARGLDALAEVVAARGQPARARALYERALRIRRVPGREDQPDVAWTLTNLARTVADLGELSAALRFVAEAIGIYRRSGAFDEPDH